MWEPLRDHEEFLACVRTAPDLAELERVLTADLGPDTTVLVCKPRPELVRLARGIEHVAPVIVDIDDPELLDPWGDATMLVRAKRIARNGRTPYRFGWTRRAVRSMHVITSNPLLQELYGGHLVPHVRVAASAPEGRATSDDVFRIGFVGTLREHKGVTELRAATAELARRRDVRLSITAPAPPDAFPVGGLGRAHEPRGGQGAARRVRRGRDRVAPGRLGRPPAPREAHRRDGRGRPDRRHRPTRRCSGPPAAPRSSSATAPHADMAEALALLADDVRLASTIATAAWRRACDAFTPAAAAPMLLEAVHHAATGQRRGV